MVSIGNSATSTLVPASPPATSDVKKDGAGGSGDDDGGSDMMNCVCLCR